jgi:hypothetical protein
MPCCASSGSCNGQCRARVRLPARAPRGTHVSMSASLSGFWAQASSGQRNRKSWLRRLTLSLPRRPRESAGDCANRCSSTVKSALPAAPELAAPLGADSPPRCPSSIHAGSPSPPPRSAWARAGNPHWGGGSVLGRRPYWGGGSGSGGQRRRCTPPRPPPRPAGTGGQGILRDSSGAMWRVPCGFRPQTSRSNRCSLATASRSARRVSPTAAGAGAAHASSQTSATAVCAR